LVHRQDAKDAKFYHREHRERRDAALRIDFDAVQLKFFWLNSARFALEPDGPVLPVLSVVEKLGVLGVLAVKISLDLRAPVNPSRGILQPARG
jgi:hypothetical protein